MSIEISRERQADHEAKKSFATQLLIAFKDRNVIDGISAAQAIHLHSFVRSLPVNMPGLPQQNPDLMNMALSGDIEAACIALMYCEVEDMSQPWHWFNAERRDWLVTELKSFLRWP